MGTLLQAFAVLPAGTQLLLAGDGPDRPALQRFGSRVHFTGFVPHTTVPAALAHVDLLVLPSLYEDLSSALIEAMAAGLPVVATQVGDTTDLVRHGVNGLLGVPAGTSGACPFTSCTGAAAACGEATCQSRILPARARAFMVLFGQTEGFVWKPGIHSPRSPVAPPLH